MRKLVLDGDLVVRLEIDGALVPLKEPIPMGEYGRLKPILDASEQLDLRTLRDAQESAESQATTTEWNDEDLGGYVESLTKAQRAYLEVLVANGEDWLFSKDLLVRLNEKTGGNFVSLSIAGIRSGLNRKAKNWYDDEHDSLDENVWNDDEWMNRYRIRPKYLSRLRKLLDKS